MLVNFIRTAILRNDTLRIIISIRGDIMENLEIDNLGQFISAVGFPSLVAIILLRTVIGNFNKKLDQLDKRLLQLNKSVIMVVKTMNLFTKQSQQTQTEQSSEKNEKNLK